MYNRSLNSSNEASFLSHKSSKVDGRIIEKLLTYIETTLDNKLNSIENLINKNKNSLSKAKKKFLEAERKIMNLKRQNLGSSLISDDIKFFFNLVKSKPKDKVIKGVCLKDGRPSPRFGGNGRPYQKQSRSKSITGAGSKKRRKIAESSLEKKKDRPPFEHKLSFNKSRKRSPFKKSERVVVPRKKENRVKGGFKEGRRKSIPRGKSTRPKSPMKRWERLYNMANEKANKAREMSNNQSDIENDIKIVNRDETQALNSFRKLKKNLESTQKKPRKYPAILDNQQSPSKKLKNQRNIRRSKRILDSKEVRRRKQRDKRCFQKITKIQEEYNSGIRYCESSDSSCENLRTHEVNDDLYQESSEFHFSSKQQQRLMKMASTESEQFQTKKYLEMMKPPQDKKRSLDTLNPTTTDTTFNNSEDYGNLENYMTDRPNHKSPIRQKRDQHPLIAFGEYQDEEEDISNTERLIHQTVGNLRDDSFSKDRTGKRLIDGMLDVDCNDSRVFQGSNHKSHSDGTWKEIEEERMQVVKMLEGMMKSTGRGDYSSAENIFKHYESLRNGDKIESQRINNLNLGTNLDKVSEKTAEYTSTEKNSRLSFENQMKKSPPMSPKDELESQLGLKNRENPLSKKSSTSNFISFKDSDFAMKTLPKHVMSEQERNNFQHISISEKSEGCKTEGFELDSFSANSNFELKKSSDNRKNLKKDPSLVFKSKAERVIIFDDESEKSDIDNNYTSFGSKSNDGFFGKKNDKVEILTKEIMKNCSNGHVDIHAVRSSVKMILSMPKEVQEQLLKNSFAT